MEQETRKPKVNTESVVGVLIPTGWNEQFGVTAMALACDGEREIAVGNLDEHPELHAAMRRRVRVEGSVTRKGMLETMDVVACHLVEETEALGPLTVNNSQCLKFQYPKKKRNGQ